MKKVITIVVGLIISANSLIQAQNCLWAKSLNGNGNVNGSSVSTDANGNVYILGIFTSPTISFGSTTLTNASTTGSYDTFLAKYDATGNVLWAKSAGGTGFDWGLSVSTDASGNVIITGFYNSPNITFGSTTLTNASIPGSDDIFISKYDASGNVLWAKSEGGTNSDFGQSVSTDASGNVLITGYYNSPNITFGSTTLTNANNTGYSSDIFITKYDASGNVLWAKSAGGTNTDYGQSVSTDVSGNVYITGIFSRPTITFGTTTITNADNTGNSFDIFIAKYDATGNVLWAKSAGATGTDNGQSVSTDASGNVYMSGYFNSPTINFGSTTLTNAGNDDIFIVKYDAAGNVLWAKSAGGTNYDYERSVSADASGNVYITGYFYSHTITFGSTLLTNADSSVNFDIYPDIFIAKYDTAGNVLWAKSAGGTSLETCHSISADASGNVYILGYFASATISFGSTTLINPIGFSSVFIAKFTGTGTGVEEMFANNELNIYPNPTTSTITLNIPKSTNTNMTITNLTGKQVAAYSIQNTTIKTIDVSHLAEGVYFVSLTSDEGMVTKKMVKVN